MSTAHLTISEVADRAGVGEDYIRRLERLRVVHPLDGAYSERDVYLVALFHMWEGSGLAAASIASAMEAGKLSLDFLDAPAWTLPPPLPVTYRAFAERHGIPLDLLRGVYESMGFVAPDPDDLVPSDDVEIAALIRLVLDYGASEQAIRRLFRTYGENLRRLARAEADLYIEELEQRWAAEGIEDAERMRRGAELGGRLGDPIDGTLRAIYHRNRQHVWAEFSVERAEIALEKAGLLERAEEMPAISFVDMTGFTRLTEERGDEEAARLATSLAALVEDVSRRYGGRAIRWLGDGGLFLFGDAGAAARAALEMSERAPIAGLPPTHIGIQAGPVVSRDGDVYGRTVNVASRIADEAGTGEVVTSQETTERLGGDDIHSERLRTVELKGVAAPVTLYRIVRS